MVALDLAYRVGIRRAVFCDTTIEFPETTEYVDTVAGIYNMKIDVVRPPIDFFTLLEQVTAPSRRQRWCCDVLKFGPLAKWAIENRVTTFVTGLRRSESVGRRDYSETDVNPLVPVEQSNPLLDWTTEQIWTYIGRYGLPVNPMYRYFERVGCWCCPFKPRSDWSVMEKHFPLKMAELKGRMISLAERLGIKDRKDFVEEFGWTHWVYPTTKVVVGSTRLCGDKIIILISGADGTALRRVASLLPILTSDFRIVAGRLRVVTGETSRKRLEILVERALNCVGCGACLCRCKEGALDVVDGVLTVNLDRCTHCQTCLNASVLKGSCISRHYSPKRSGITRADSDV